MEITAREFLEILQKPCLKKFECRKNCRSCKVIELCNEIDTVPKNWDIEFIIEIAKQLKGEGKG